MLLSDPIKELAPKIENVLSDGKWHTFAEFLELGESVPAEIASQKFIQSVKKTDREAAKLRPIAEQIDQGRRNILARILNEKVRSGDFEKKGAGFG